MQERWLKLFGGAIHPRPKGTMARGKTAYAINRNGYHLVIDNVPAWVCQQCGEPYFEGKEVDAIQEVVKAVDSRILKAPFARP